MNNYKLIALDLDGTLNNSKKVITDKTREALIKAQQLGSKIVLASGRPTAGLVREAEILEMKKYNGMFLSFNGARVVEYKTDKCIYDKALSSEDTHKMLKHLKKFNVNVMVAWEQYLLVEDLDGYKSEYEARVNNLKLKKVDDLDKYIDFEPNKILISAEPKYLESVADEIKKPFGSSLSIYFSTPFYLEVMANNIDKALALDKIAKHLGIKREEVIAFGDGQNDIPMIKYAGLGVAMANAADELKTAADEITLSNDEDGIAYMLSKKFDEIQF